MSTFHYNDTPLPVGVPVYMNGSDESYELGLYDGALYSDQYADEPEEGVLFESREAAKRWLDAVTAALGDRMTDCEQPQTETSKETTLSAEEPTPEHRCGRDYDQWCDGCRTAYGDAGMSQ